MSAKTPKVYDVDRVAVLVPCNTRIEPDCEDALAELERRGFAVWRCHGINILDMVRSWMVHKCLRGGAQAVFFIDADIAFDPDDVERLIRSGNVLTCGVYPKKNGTDFAAIAGDGQRWTDIPFGPKGVCMQIQSAGFGFAFIDTDVFRALDARPDMKKCMIEDGKDFRPYFMPMTVDVDGTRFYLEPDYAFCNRCYEAGIPLVADTTIKLHHLGTYRWTYDDVFIRAALARLKKEALTVDDIAKATAEVDTAPDFGVAADIGQGKEVRDVGSLPR